MAVGQQVVPDFPRPLDRSWRTIPNDLIGGWCVTDDPGCSPGEGAPSVANFVSKDVAVYIMCLHNSYLESVRRALYEQVEATTAAV